MKKKRKLRSNRETRARQREDACALWEQHYAIEALAQVVGVDRRMVLASRRDSRALLHIAMNFRFKGYLKPMLDFGRDPLPHMVEALRRSGLTSMA